MMQSKYLLLNFIVTWITLTGCNATSSPAVTPLSVDIDATVNARVQATQAAQASVNELIELPVDASTVAPPALDIGNILWQDDFEDGINDSWQVALGDWRVTNGYLVPTSEELNSMIVGGSSDWKNYSVQITIDQFSDLYYSGGILVHMQDAENFMRLRAFDSVLSHGTYWEIVQNGEGQIIPGTEISYRMSRPPYQIKVVVDGSKYEAYIDGERQSSFTDDTFNQGYIGLQSFGYLGLPNNPHLAGFDDLLVLEK